MGLLVLLISFQLLRRIFEGVIEAVPGARYQNCLEESKPAVNRLAVNRLFCLSTTCFVELAQMRAPPEQFRDSRDTFVV